MLSPLPQLVDVETQTECQKGLQHDFNAKSIKETACDTLIAKPHKAPATFHNPQFFPLPAELASLVKMR